MTTLQVKIYRSDLTANIDAAIVNDVKEKYPKKEMMVCFDEECELSKLNKDESVCYGDGKNFYIVLKGDD